jgi:ATP-dependent protease ClpP protease subunit
VGSGFLFKPTDDPSTVELQFGDGIGFSRNGDAGEWLRRLSAELDALSPSVSEISVRINAIGGHSHIAVGMHNLLRAWRGRVVTSSDNAWSTGSIVAQAGSVRRMAADGIFGMHHAVLHIDFEICGPSGVATFPAADLRRYADQLDGVDEWIVRIFAERTGRSASDVRGLLNKDDCMNAQEALAWGLVDEITAPVGRRQDWPEHLSPKIREARRRAEVFNVGATPPGTALTNDAERGG